MKIDSSTLQQYDTQHGDLARELGIHKTTLTNWAKNRPGFPQPLRLSRTLVRYNRAAVMRYLLEQGA